MEKNLKPYFIGISGGSASGKTSVAVEIFERIGIKECILISMDSYYKRLTPEIHQNLSKYNFDHPNAFDFDLLFEQLYTLLDGKSIQMPVYNFNVSQREDFTKQVNPGKVIIFEGIFALYDKVILKK